MNLLRRQTARGWVLYLLGAVPLSLTVLTFAREMRSGVAADRCLAESFICAVVFFWAAFWKARFAGSLQASLAEVDDAADRTGSWECIFTQGVLQGLKLCLLPFAVIAIVPLPWFSAVFRAVNAEADRPGVTPLSALRKAAALASSDGKKNWMAMLVCSIAALVIFVNVFVLLLLLPELWKTFTGIETDWTRNAHIFRTANAFSVGVAATWLIIDPLLQAYSAVRTFHSEARSDGRDLMLQLRHLPAATLLLMLLLAGVTSAASIHTPAKTGPNGAALTDADIKQGIDRVTAGSDYGWLRASNEAPLDDWFGAWLLRGLAAGIRHAESWIFDLVHRILGHDEKPSTYKEPLPTRAPNLRWLMYGLAGLLAIAMMLAVVRTRRSAPPVIGSAVMAAALDLNADDVLASERPDEHWLAMAEDFRARGDLRLAIRALYLSNLAYLGAHQFLGVSKSKSNAIYERELGLRCRVEEVCRAFARANRNYERVWYGMHDVTPELWQLFEQEISAVRSRA